jgi:excisionase family DNA binding protein
MPYSKPIVQADWIRVTEAAALVDCDPRTLIRMINRGEMNVRAMRFGNTARIHRGDFDRELNKRVSVGVSA